MFPKIRKQQIDKNWMLIGRTIEDNPLYLDMTEAIRGFVVGMTRLSGKTSLLRRINDLAYLSGWSSVWLTDVANEIRSSKNAQNNAHLLSLLNKDDVPQALPIKVYRFNFFNNFLNEQLPEDNLPFTIAYKDVTLPEWWFALGFDKISMMQYANLIAMHYNKCTSLQQLVERIQKDNSIKKSTKMLIESRIRPLIAYQVFSDTTTDFLQDIKDGIPIVFNVSRFEEVGSKFLPTAPSLYMKIVMRLIVSAKENGYLPKSKRILIIVDEAPKFLRDKESEFFKDMQEIVNVKTKLGIYLLFAAQFIDDFEQADFVVKQARYVIFSVLVDVDDIVKLIKTIQRYDFHPFWKRDLSQSIRHKAKRIPKGARGWVLLDRLTRESKVFVAYPSLSQHTASQI